MPALIILSPTQPANVTASRGDGASRLLTPDPKEAFFDTASGSALTITIDLGSAQTVDSVFLGSTNADPAATWAISSGLANGSETAWTGAITMAAPFRIASKPRMSFFRRGAVDASGRVTPSPIVARYIAVTINQPSAAPALIAGNIATGLAFQPYWGNEFGSGRAIIDTGASEANIGGGFGTYVGVRKGLYSCVMGDLTTDETEALYALFDATGETQPVVLIEGQIGSSSPVYQERYHWGLWRKLEAFERLDPANTKQSVTIEEWR